MDPSYDPVSQSFNGCEWALTEIARQGAIVQDLTLKTCPVVWEMPLLVVITGFVVTWVILLSRRES
jgi:hypothetical protein